jgi:hypothetical protein
VVIGIGKIILMNFTVWVPAGKSYFEMKRNVYA